MITIYDPATQLMRLNTQFEQLIGWNSEEAAGMSLMETVYPDPLYREQVAAFMDRCLENEWMDIQMQTRGGRTLETSWSNIRLSNDVRVGIGIDITERKRVEEQLRQASEFDSFSIALTDTLRSLNEPEKILSEALRVLGEKLQVDRVLFSEIANDDETIFILDNYVKEGVPRLTGRASLSDYGKARGPLSAGQYLIINDAATSPDMDEKDRAAFADLSIRSGLGIPLIKNGRWVATLGVHHGSVHTWSENEIKLAVETAERTWSALERAHAQEAVRRNEQMVSTLVNAAPFGVYFIDSEFRLRSINRGAEAVFSGIDPLIGRDFAEILRIIWKEPFATQAIERFWHTLRTGESYLSPPVVEERANVEEIEAYDWQIHRITLNDGTFGVVCYFYDLSEQKRMESAVRASEALYRAIARNIPGGGVYVVDKDFRYLVAEGPVTEAFGLVSEMLEGRTVMEVFPDERGTRMEDRLRRTFAGETVSFETKHNGRVFWTQQAPLSDSIGQAIILTIDITERKQAEEALRQSEERFARFMHHLPGLAWIKDLQGRYVYANAAAEQAFNAPQEQLYARTDEDIFPRDVAAQFKKNDEQALADEKGLQVIETLKQPDGVLHYALVSKFPIPGPDGSTTLIGGTAFDITERLHAEEALRESEERFRAIVRQATAGIVRKDADGRLIFVNEAFCTMLGRTEADLLGRSIWDLMHADDIVQNKQSYERMMTEGIAFKLERRLIREDGSIIWVDASVSPIMDANGKPLSAVAVEVDITGRKQAEEALLQLNLQLEDRVLNRTAKLRAVNQTLREEIAERQRVEEALRKSEATARENEEKLRTLFELLPVGISFLDLGGQVIQANPALANILKLPRGPLSDELYRSRKYIRSNGTLMPPAEFASRRALTEGRTIYNVETGVVLESSEVVWTSVSAAPVDVADVGAVVVTVDITESKLAERALQESRERLQFLSQRLVEVQEEERRAIARELHDRVGQTLAALNINLLIISGQLSGKVDEQISSRLNDSMKLVAETIALVRDVMSNLRPSVLDDYGLEAAIESHLSQYVSRYEIDARFEKPDQPIPRLVPSMEMTFLRIAQEALMNIARHAQASQVNVLLWQEAGTICMTVQDNGAGITSWESANRPGSHGLTIMRERAEAFGGSLKVSSVPGKGTTVEVRIPMESNNPSQEQEENSP
jgi:PAS domain S-box-containing protein